MFFTPGPNNIMLLSSGLTLWFPPDACRILRASPSGSPLWSGWWASALGRFSSPYPVLQTILKYAGIGYLIYLAAAIAMSGPVSAQDNRRGPMTFWGAAMFQWINVKGWVMAIGTITAYAASPASPGISRIQIMLSLLLGASACSAWALFGSRCGRS